MSDARVSSPRATRAPIACCALTLLAISCGPPRINLPSGTGSPFPDAIAAYASAVRDCRAVQTLSASLSLSGRAGSTKLSARIDAGFAAPSRLRLEGYPRIAFGGRPFFVLVANGSDATLVLTRDNRVLRGAAPSAIIEALTGVALTPDEMRSLMAGCGFGTGEPGDGRSFDRDWASVQTGSVTVFLRRLDSQWRIGGARRGSLQIEYSEFAGTRPTSVRLRTTSSAGVVPADLSIRMSQVEMNTTLENNVFTVEVPKDAAPLTLEELRRAGPLGETKEATEGTVPDQNGGTKIRSTNGDKDAPVHPSMSNSTRGRMHGRIFPSFVFRFPRFSVLIVNRSLRRLP
jgi:hypothetical protein